MAVSFRLRLACQASLTAVALAGVTLAQPALAQASSPVSAGNVDPDLAKTIKDQPADTQDQPGDIVVTGSRIRRDNFNTPSHVITREDRILAGSRSTADALQSSSVTSGTSQVNGAFLGFVSENGAAADTVGLRGLGASRTLILLNGRRLAPAGVGNQLVAADLNTLPTALVQRVEVLREGASSVYGSDAIAGVINVITDTKVNGVTLDAYTDQPTQQGQARSYRMSVVAGKTFERGHITGSLEYRQFDGMRVGARKAFSCPRDLFFDPVTGAEVGQHLPGTNQLQCFPYTTNGGSGTASGYGIAGSFNGLPATRLTYANGDINSYQAVNGLDRVGPSQTQLFDHILSPVKTYTGYLNGSYELGILGDAEIYGEALYTRRESHQDSSYQLNFSGQGLSGNDELYGGSYYGTPLSAYGIPTSPFYPTALAASNYQSFTPFIIPNRTVASKQRVNFFRGNAGLRGSLPFGNWRYDANFQYSRTSASESLQQITTPRLDNALQTVLAPAGTPSNLTVTALPGQIGAGNNYTCASNVNNGVLVAGASCVPLNLYDPAIFLNGALPSNVFNYLFQNETDHTKFLQQTISINVDGTLFNLPAGPVGVALGFEHRFDHINDVPSLAAQTGTLYNRASAGITRGSDYVNEAYGEINIPLLRDKPFFQDLELSGSGRYTHYRSYGSDWTYHINGQWAPVKAVRFRGNYGTSFRAPNLYEQFVAGQTGFFPSSADPCSGFAALAPTATLYKNCAAQLVPILGAAATTGNGFIATAGPQVTTVGGAGLLDAEHSTAYGGGVVLTAPRHVADLSLAIDYYHVEVKGEVTTLGSLILNRCYEAEDFPTNQYCALIDPRLPATDPQKGNLSSFLNPFLNVSRQISEGIDFDLRYGADVFGGKFVFRGQATRMLHQKYQLFAEEAISDYNGTLGVQGFGAGPKWVANGDFTYTFPGDKVLFRYGLQYVGPQDSSEDPTAAPFLGLVATDLHAETYWEHSASIQYRWKDIGAFTLGVTNLTNAKPPRISSFPTSGGQFTRVGNYFNSSNYYSGIIGRSVFLNVTRSF